MDLIERLSGSGGDGVNCERHGSGLTRGCRKEVRYRLNVLEKFMQRYQGEIERL
jgi:hypothetical protein